MNGVIVVTHELSGGTDWNLLRDFESSLDAVEVKIQAAVTEELLERRLRLAIGLALDKSNDLISREELDQSQPAVDVGGRAVEASCGAVDDSAKLLMAEVVERETRDQPCLHLFVCLQDRCLALLDPLDRVLPEGQPVQGIGGRSEGDRHVPVDHRVLEPLDVDLADQVTEVVEGLVATALFHAEAGQVDPALEGVSIVGEKLLSNRDYSLDARTDCHDTLGRWKNRPKKSLPLAGPC